MDFTTTLSLAQAVAVDFDGTLCRNKWPEIGAANHRLIKLLKEHRRIPGARLILWTCRDGDLLPDETQRYLSLRFSDDRKVSQKDAGAALGWSQMTAHRRERAALDACRAALADGCLV